MGCLYIPQFLRDVKYSRNFFERIDSQFNMGCSIPSIVELWCCSYGSYHVRLSDGRCSNFTPQDWSLGLNTCAVWTLNTFHLVWHNLKLHHWCSTIVVGTQHAWKVSPPKFCLFCSLSLALPLFLNQLKGLRDRDFLVSHGCTGTRLCFLTVVEGLLLLCWELREHSIAIH